MALESHAGFAFQLVAALAIGAVVAEPEANADASPYYYGGYGGYGYGKTPT